ITALVPDRAGHVAVIIGDQIVFMGGSRFIPPTNPIKNSIRVYNLSDEVFSLSLSSQFSTSNPSYVDLSYSSARMKFGSEKGAAVLRGASGKVVYLIGGIQQNLTQLHEVDNNSKVTSNQTLMIEEINKTYNMTRQFVFFYQPYGKSWSYPLDQKGAAPSRRRSTSTVINSKGVIYIFGGRVQVDTGSPMFVSYNDLYTFDTVLLTWNQINATNVPSPRSHAAPVMLPSGKILYIGGVSQTRPGVDVSLVDMNEPIIVQPRIAHTANLMPDNNEIIIVGGSSNIQCKTWVTTFAPGRSICNSGSNIDAGIVVCFVLSSIIGILYKRGIITDWLDNHNNWNIISSEDRMEIYNASKQNVIYEYACSNSFSRFELSNLDVPKSKERNNIVYDDIYNNLSCIELLKPNIAISNNGKSNIWNSTDCITISDFMSVHATITQGITPAACDNIEKLLSMLNKQKISIYKVLDSQPVYALGPDFQQGHHIPCIACWSIKPIDISIMKQLSALLDDEFEIVNHINDNDCNQDRSYENDDNGDYEEDRNEKDERNGSEGNGNDEGSGNDDGNVKNDGKSNSFIQASSVANAKLKDEFQSFSIDAYLWASINIDEHVPENVLEFNINLFNCGVGEMLNEICQLPHGFVGYYLDSIKIRVTPLPYKSNDKSNLFMIKKEYSPQHLNCENIECSASNEKNIGVQITLGPQNTGITVNRNDRINHGTKATTRKWNMDMTNCRTKGVQWSYSFNADDLYKNGDNRKTVNLQLHSGSWFTSCRMNGFCVTIIQVLRCEFKPMSNFFNFKVKPAIVKKCPQLVHTLEISFNDLTNFNEGFAKLTKRLHMEHKELSVILETNTLSSISTSQETGIMGIDRILFSGKSSS
ncbi:3926_t:CDS:2, partial [Gigaspora margarita]